jgi:hypothetical protein
LLKPPHRAGKRKTRKISSHLRHFAVSVRQEQHPPQRHGNSARNTPLSATGLMPGPPIPGGSHLMPGRAIGEPPCSGPAMLGAALGSRASTSNLSRGAAYRLGVGLSVSGRDRARRGRCGRPLAFVSVDGNGRGFSPREKTLLAALWPVPLTARSVAL